MGLLSMLQPASVGSPLTSQPTGLLDLLLGNSNPVSQFADSHSNVLGAIGAGIASGPTFSQGLANAAQMVPQAKVLDQQTRLALQQQGMTYQYLAKKYPDLAAAVQGGMPIQAAWTEAMKRESPTPVSLSPGAKLVNPYTGATIAQQAPNPMSLAPGSILVNPQTGQQIGGNAQQWTNVTDAQQRAAFGISPDDKTPYQVNAATGQLRYAGGPQSTVNVNNTSETAFNKAVGDARGANYTSLVKGAQDAQNTIQTLQQLGSVLSTSGYQGPGGEQALQMRKLGAALGLDVSATNDAQVAEALSKQLALQYRNPEAGAGMPGSLSDSDRQFLQSMAPGLDKTPGANQKLIDALTKVQQRKIEVAALADQYVQQHGTLDSGFNALVTQYNQQHPIFGGATNFSTSAPAGNTTSTGVTWSVKP